MWPTLLHLPLVDVDLPTYGALLTLGIAAGVALVATLAARDGADPVRVYRVSLVVVAVSLLSSHLMWLVNAPAALASLSLGDVLVGGTVFYGGLVGGLVAAPFAARAVGLSWRLFADAAAPGVALGQALGRVGCFAAGCCWGTACDYPWGVVFPGETVRRTHMPWGVPLHPVQLYEAVIALAIAAALVALHRRRAFAGQVALAYLVLYPLARFAVEFWRGDDRGELFGLAHATGLSPSQLVSLALVAIALSAAPRARRNGVRVRGPAIRVGARP
jgi:phosphatidylglycerol:prolipoprotein diacylglycerol transferase